MRFDRQILYLVYLFASTYAAPAAIPATTASLADSPSLTLTFDIPPQLISSAADFASHVVSAVFADEDDGSPPTTTRSSRRVDRESSSLAPYPSTTRIGAPSGPKTQAVTFSTSTSRRSATRLPPDPGAAHSTASSEPADFTTTQRRPRPSSSATAHQASSPQRTTTPRPAPTHAAGEVSPSNSTRLNRTMDQDSEPPNMIGATNTADGLGRLLTAIGQIGTLSGSSPASAITATEAEAAEPINALDVLISALPSSLAEPIQSQFSDIIDPIGSGINSLASDIFGAGAATRTRPTQTNSSPSDFSAPTKPSLTTTTTPTTSATTSPTPLPPPTTTSTDPTSTTLSRPTDTDPSAANATSTDAPTSASNPSPNAAVAGIATGVASGVVLILLAAVFLYRRRQQGRAPFSRRAGGGSKRGNAVYPEVAWLYDPDITPPRSRAGSDAGQHLIPAPRPGSVEIGGTPVLGPGGGGRSHEPRASSPLLAPVARGSRDVTGSRSRSGSEVEYERLRPLSAVREESARGSMS